MEHQTSLANTDVRSSGLAVSPGSGIERATAAAREWCRRNPGWEAICDMAGTDHLYFGWEDLTKGEKISWRLRYGEQAPAIFEYQCYDCKVATGFIDENGNFSDGVPFGVVGMMVFNSQNNKLTDAPNKGPSPER